MNNILISRNDAVEVIKKEIQDFETKFMHEEDNEEYGHDIGFVAGLHRAKAFIRSLPSADTVSREFYEDAVKANIGLVIENRKLKEQLESAEAEKTVIRSRTLMPTKDFKEWVKRIREINPNAIVIPCDAEVVSADAMRGWIPLSYDDYDLVTDFPHECDGEWVIVTDGKNISVERIKKDAYDHFFPNGRWFELEDVIAWMPLPKPYEFEEKGAK